MKRRGVELSKDLRIIGGGSREAGNWKMDAGD